MLFTPKEKKSSTKLKIIKADNFLEGPINVLSLIKLHRLMEMSYCFFLLLQTGVQKHTFRPNIYAKKNILTTIADRRRAGPPAFRRKYCQTLYATLSPTQPYDFFQTF